MTPELCRVFTEDPLADALGLWYSTKVAKLTARGRGFAGDVMENLGLAEVAGRLFQQFGERAPSYRQLCDLVASGRTPARKVGARWQIASLT